ncbi:MAG: tetratricopeptide repeat protein [Gemmatimonadota bacterium]
MRPTTIQLLWLAGMLAAAGWMVYEPSPEPFIALTAGIIGFLSFGREQSRPAAVLDEPPPTRRSVAVLPLEHLGTDESEGFLADGMSEDIIARLAKVDDLRVISSSSVMRFRHRHVDPAEIAHELSVRSILDGTIRQEGERVRVVVKLTDCATRQQLWAERYDREAVDRFALQTEIAESVAAALDVELAHETVRSVPDPEAYRLHLLARFHANKWSQDGWRKAVEHLEEAIGIDPSYPGPRSTLAYVYGIRAYMHTFAPTEAFQRAEQEARLALAMDDRETEAHMALGLVHYWLHWDWQAALSELTRAVELSPGDATARSFLGMVLDTLRRHEDAMRHRRLAYELDPLNPLAALNVGYGYMIGRRFETAIGQFERALELDPENAAATYGLGMVQADIGDVNAACRTFELGMEKVDSGSAMYGFLGWAYAVAGRTDEAHAVLDGLLREDRWEARSSFHVAMVYLGLGDRDGFFSWLDRAMEERSPWMVWFHVTPSLDAAAGDPRYGEVLRRLHLPTGPG